MEIRELQAIVRGCSSVFAEALMVDDYYYNSQSSCFVPFDYNEQQKRVGSGADYGFSNCFDGNATIVFDELDELYKPFYPQSVDLDIHDSSIMCVPSEVKQTPIKSTNNNAVVGTTMPKRRKCTSKRVVKQVKVDDLSLDTWAWRKYGKKTIKGSPYPRSYYRCSTSKGCSATKQVEQSNSNPTMFIITYTNDHNHSQPIRRSTLVGKAKQKLSKVTSTMSGGGKYETPASKESSRCSPISSTIVFSSPVLNESSSYSPVTSTSTFSPWSPLMMSCVEDQFSQFDSNQKVMEYDEQTIGNYCMRFTDASTFEDWFSDQTPMTFQW